jgi:hypothetical protein
MKVKKKTIVKGIRASQDFFDKCDLVSKAEGVDRNKLIVRVVSEYCDKPKFTEVLTNLHCLNCGGKIAERFYDDGEKVFICHNCSKRADLVEKMEND